LSAGFRVPSSPPPAHEDDEDMSDRDAEGEEEEEEEGGGGGGGGEGGEDDADMTDEDQFTTHRRPKSQDHFAQSVISRVSAEESLSTPAIVQSGVKQQHYDLINLAHGLTPYIESPALHESNETILETERLMAGLADAFESSMPERRATVLADVSSELVDGWNTRLSLARRGARPGAAATALSTASKLADLLLSIHHPRSISRQGRGSGSSQALVVPGSQAFTPIPKILLDWLNTNRSINSELDTVLKETRGYSRKAEFWDAVHASAIRGQFQNTLLLLQGANFEVAATAQEDLNAPGYSGHHLEYAREACRAATNLIRQCPAIISDDWDIKGHDWTIFRQRIHQTFDDLQELAEGDSKSRYSMSQSFQAPHFGISQSQTSFNLSVASRKAESKVPWSVYENLSKLYQLLLGNEEELMSTATDWIEATFILTIWWDGDEEAYPQGSLAASRRSLARSQRIRTSDVTPVTAYCERLGAAFAAALNSGDDDLAVNTADRFEVGIACIIDDCVEGALQLLKGLSLTIASAVAEVASAGEWLKRKDGGVYDELDQSDLMVLSYTEERIPGISKAGISKDDLLAMYAQQLTAKSELATADGKSSREGWELAVQVLGRMDDIRVANERIQKILDELPLESSERVDKITELCHQLGLSSQALGISLVSKNTTNLHSWLSNKIRNMPITFGPTPGITAIPYCTMLELMLRPRSKTF